MGTERGCHVLPASLVFARMMPLPFQPEMNPIVGVRSWIADGPATGLVGEAVVEVDGSVVGVEDFATLGFEEQAATMQTVMPISAKRSDASFIR